VSNRDPYSDLEWESITVDGVDLLQEPREMQNLQFPIANFLWKISSRLPSRPIENRRSKICFRYLGAWDEYIYSVMPTASTCAAVPTGQLAATNAKP
jgi:hypothetical protein